MVVLFRRNKQDNGGFAVSKRKFFSLLFLISRLGNYYLRRQKMMLKIIALINQQIYTNIVLYNLIKNPVITSLVSNMIYAI